MCLWFWVYGCVFGYPRKPFYKDIRAWCLGHRDCHGLDCSLQREGQWACAPALCRGSAFSLSSASLQWSHMFLLIEDQGAQGYELFFKTRELKKKWMEQFEMAM